MNPKCVGTFFEFLFCTSTLWKAGGGRTSPHFLNYRRSTSQEVHLDIVPDYLILSGDFPYWASLWGELLKGMLSYSVTMMNGIVIPDYSLPSTWEDSTCPRTATWPCSFAEVSIEVGSLSVSSLLTHGASMPSHAPQTPAMEISQELDLSPSEQRKRTMHKKGLRHQREIKLLEETEENLCITLITITSMGYSRKTGLKTWLKNKRSVDKEEDGFCWDPK